MDTTNPEVITPEPQKTPFHSNTRLMIILIILLIFLIIFGAGFYYTMKSQGRMTNIEL